MSMTKNFCIAATLALGAMAGSAQAAYGYGDGRYHDDRGYGDTVRCESRDNRTRWCPIDTRYGVRLVDQLSRNSCIRGRTWGTDGRGLWVTRGCRGVFRLDDRRDYYGRNNGGSIYYGNGTVYGGGAVRCESRDGRTRYCGMDTRGGVQLVDQHSQNPCIRGSSWGVSGDRVWVSRGCRATFATSDRYGYNPGYYDRY